MYFSHALIGLAVALFLGFCAPASATSWQTGDVITFAQDAWGEPTSAAGGMLGPNFDNVYINALEVGIPGTAGFSMRFFDVLAIFDFLPAAGPPGPLTSDLIDPSSSSAGVFGGNVVALQLDVDFSNAGILQGTSGVRFGDLVLAGFGGELPDDLKFLNGLTISQFLTLVNQLLGGGGGGEASLIEDLNPIVFALTQSFLNGTPSAFAQLHLERAKPAPPLGTACNGVFDSTFRGNVTVSAGQNCTFISPGEITGNVNVVGGNFVLKGAAVDGNVAIRVGTFTLETATIGGGLDIEGIPPGSTSNSICGTMVNKNLTLVANDTAVQIGSNAPQICPGNRIGGNFTAKDNASSVLIFANSVTGNMSASSNTGPLYVVGNTIGGNLQCLNNSNLIMGGGNTAKQKRGQCN